MGRCTKIDKEGGVATGTIFWAFGFNFIRIRTKGAKYIYMYIAII